MTERTSLGASETLRTSFVLNDIDSSSWNDSEYPHAVITMMPMPLTEKYLVNHNDGSRSFVGLSVGNEGKSIFGKVIDEKNRVILGETVFGYFGTEYPPRVISDFTASGLIGQGFARRRKMIANQICKERLGMALHSSTARSPIAEGFWRRLVEQNLAKETVDPHGKKIYSLV